MDFCGASIPILFAFLPYKTEMSYFMVVFFLFFAFNKYWDEIKRLTGKDLISLRKLKSDFDSPCIWMFQSTYLYIYGPSSLIKGPQIWFIGILPMNCKFLIVELFGTDRLMIENGFIYNQSKNYKVTINSKSNKLGLSPRMWFNFWDL